MRRTGLVLSWVLLANVAGCVRRVVDGDTSTYSVELWVPLLTAGFGLAIVAVGYYLHCALFREAKLLHGYGIMALGVVAGVVMTWLPLRDQTIIDKDHFEVHVGKYHYSIRFDELKQITAVRTETVDSKGKPFTRYELDCELKSRAHRIINIGGDVTRAAVPQLIEECQQFGIPFLNEDLLGDHIGQAAPADD